MKARSNGFSHKFFVLTSTSWSNSNYK